MAPLAERPLPPGSSPTDTGADHTAGVSCAGSADATAWLGLGSNLGDRQLNVALAMGRLRRTLDVVAASPVYDTAPVGPVEQPRFINTVVGVRTEMSPRALLAELQRIERDLGRRREGAQRFGPRPIDIDLLLYGDLVVGADDASGDGLELPHPRLHERAFVLVPLADVAPDLRHPVLGVTARELRDRVDTSGVRRVERGLLAGFARDVQAEAPAHGIALARVGVTGIERVIRLATGRPVELFFATIDMFVDLSPERKGVHMSRFPHLVDQTLDDLMRVEAPDIESLAGRVAEDLVSRQSAAKAEVHLRAKVPRTRHTPLTAQRTQDLFLLLGSAVADASGSARLVGVEVVGMTACPCAQDMVRDHARSRLRERGLTAAQADAALEVVPLASHSQRSVGTLMVSAHPSVSADELVRIVEAGMSSEIYELLKRPDEFFVVNRAHLHPKFVEDAVRDMLVHTLRVYPELPDEAYVLARQRNQESIHRHDVFAERGALVGELRGELAGGPPGREVRLEAWLAAAPGIARTRGGPGTAADPGLAPAAGG